MLTVDWTNKTSWFKTLAQKIILSENNCDEWLHTHKN